VNATVEKLFEHTMNLTVFHQDNWTAVARGILEEFQKDIVRQT
ncbi:unnamed protein product, partial [Rotaria sp. Silwood1]